ncbi:hypothetical protein [Gelidibacter salicanalis]|uniref:Uncharacterized protein n=1 Tax=Gelidibacter salicanalis TaxID=291193 RepID=A0A934NIM5_9FLAO|nr:hypothetical protein [Gelidibacter salicanalis]MBJ7881353.1 hypothetical protein [Gelidibacter salicanalis]
MKRHKATRFFIIALVLFIQIAFLTMIVKETYAIDTRIAILLIGLIVLTLLFGHKYLDLHHDEYAYEKASIALWVPVGALLCYLLYTYTDVGNVIAAAIIGTAASFLPNINRNSDYLKKLPTAIYCGVFVGMSSPVVAPSVFYVIAAGIIAGVVFLLSKNLFVGIGGKLGTIAFVGVVMVTLINFIS